MAITELNKTYGFNEERFEALRQIVPEAFADGKVNWTTLKESLGEYIENEDSTENFGLFWTGKTEARRLAAKVSNGTLIPLPGTGIDEETTENIFIEGDNLEVIKVLRKSYKSKIKMIYIDPPYNTGNDFIYKDDYSEPLESYLRKTKQKDEEGNLLTTNKRADGRFHSNWLNMIYPRLRVAKDLLCDDGIIFVSIDDNEVQNLRQVMNEVFGEENHLSTFVWRTDGNFDNQAKVKKCHEYIMAYAKVLDLFPAPPVVDLSVPKNSKLFNDEIKNTIVKNGPKNPMSEVILPVGFPAQISEGLIPKRTNSFPHYLNDAEISNFKLANEVRVNSGWSSKDLLLEYISSNFNPILDGKGQETTFGITKDGTIEIIKKRSDKQSHVISVLTNVGSTQNMSAELEKMGIYFDYPKPVEMLKYLLSMVTGKDFIVLDFFSGSGTTAHAVYNLNKLDLGKRKFICVQIDEKIKEDTKIYKSELKTISEITSKRIRLASKSLKGELNSKLPIEESTDLGFRSYRLEKSNFRKWNEYQGNSIKELGELFRQFESPLIDDWQIANVLTEIILIEGFPLSSKQIIDESFERNTVYCISHEFNEHRLYVCLDNEIYEDTIDEVAELPQQDIFVCLDSALSDEAKISLADVCQIKTF